ncbi:MAG: hypothetical protein V1875_09550 [Candidatus Altiarchaeota archaeon]
MYGPETIAIFAISLFSTIYLTKRFISRFHQGGYVVRDMYKPGRPKVPTMGGVALLGGVMVSLVAAEILIRDNVFVEKLLVFYFVIMVYGVFGLLDDLIQVQSRMKKVYILYFLALPIALLNIDTTAEILHLQIPLGWIYSFILAPLYVMVVANLINMHAGFNGLDSGLTIILLTATGLKAYMKADGDTLLYLAPILGGIIGFYLFNRYPSRIFSGNSGSLMFGASVGGLIILYNLETFGVVILIPHIINFFLWIYWLIHMDVYPHIKFAKVRKDGTIAPPNKLTMKYLVTTLFKVNEQQAVVILYAVTISFCLISLLAVP